MSDHKTPVKDSLDEAEVSTTKNLDTRVWRRCVVRCISEASEARTIYLHRDNNCDVCQEFENYLSRCSAEIFATFLSNRARNYKEHPGKIVPG